MTTTFGFDLAGGLVLAIAFGGMTFFSAVMAPLVFMKLPAATAGGFIRQVFPWYYLSMGAASALAAGALAAAALLARSELALAAALAAAVAVGFWFARQILMPRINAARDAKEPRRFERLHRASVIVNAVQWLLLAAALVLVLG